jgi:hypothetical protein
LQVRPQGITTERREVVIPDKSFSKPRHSGVVYFYTDTKKACFLKYSGENKHNPTGFVKALQVRPQGITTERREVVIPDKSFSKPRHSGVVYFYTDTKKARFLKYTGENKHNPTGFVKALQVRPLGSRPNAERS